MATAPTHEQAQLHLQVYDQRREARMRQARDWFFKNYIVNSLEDAMRIAPPGTESGAFAMMVATYWEQACALLNYGLLHEDLFFETSGEFFGVWERVKPMVPAAREQFKSPHFFGHLEKAAARFEAWAERRAPGHVAAMRQMMSQMQPKPTKGEKKMRFMVIVKADKDSEAGVLPSHELLAAMGKYNEELAKAGVMLAGEGLQPSSKGARVKFSGGKKTVIDGPFVETKELVAGYWLWQVKSREEAIEWLKRAPFDNTEVELRQVFEDDDFGEAFTPELREQEARIRRQTQG